MSNQPTRRDFLKYTAAGSAAISTLGNDTMPDWDVYDSLTSSVITPISELSVSQGSKPVEFPDFTRGEWKSRPSLELT